MDRNVSTEAIQNGIEYLKIEFIGNLDSNVEDAIASYKSIQENALSSATVDQITNEIQAKVRNLQTEFNELADKLKQGMFLSQEEIVNHRNALENQLSNGTY